MKPLPCTLTLIIAGTLAASTAQAQAPTVAIPDGTIGVQFEFVPFSVAPRSAAPPRQWVSDISPSLNCPMPVLRGNMSADDAIVMSPGSTVPPVPMPGANANAGPFCRNPIGDPMKVFVW